MSVNSRRQLAFQNDNPVIYSFLKKMRAQYWPPEAISLSKEKSSYKNLSKSIQDAVFKINCFFGTSDGYVMKNIEENFKEDLKEFPDICQVLTAIEYNELIHSETYANVIRAICDDPSEFNSFIEASTNFPAIARIHDWIEKYMNRETPYPIRCLVFILLEGMIFSSCFAYIHNLKAQIRNDSMEGLIDSNEYIAKDEGVHTDFAITLFLLLTTEGSSYYKYERPSLEQVKHVILEAIEIADEFVDWYMEGDHITINAEKVKTYIRHIANEITGDKGGLGYGKFYDCTNPFEWMFSLNLSSKANFFEKHSSDYRRDMQGDINYDTIPDF